jgi:uncharacterized membrane protein
LGYYDGKLWSSSGWWEIPPGVCSELVGGALLARYYYLHASQKEPGRAWDGHHEFCVKSGRFAIQGRDDCRMRGFESKRFFEVDTGNSLDWVQNLSN